MGEKGNAEMTPLYVIAEKFPSDKKYTIRRVEAIRKNWWSLEVMPRTLFEDAEHVLEATDDDYRPGVSDECGDVNEVDSAIWAFPEFAWDWLPKLEESGCRIAHKVRVKRGAKQYKIVYCAPILDLLDHSNTEFTWNDGTISSAQNCHFYEWDGEPPMMFQVMFHNRKEYRGVTDRPSKRCFVSQNFVDEYKNRGLTGVNFYPVPRTKRPAHTREPKSVIVYRP